MKNIILLMKDNTISLVNDKKFHCTNNIKYVIIPIIEYNANTYLMIKANQYMNFTKAVVKINLTYKWRDFCESSSDIDNNFAHIEKEYTNIIEFYNALHSLNRYVYANTMLKSCSNWEYCSFIDAPIFSITLYDNKRVLYTKTIYTSSGDSDNLINILSNIKDIYNPKANTINKDEHLMILNNRWKISAENNKDAIYGIRLYNTDSIYFMDYKKYAVFSDISFFSLSMNVMGALDKKHIVKNRNISEDDIENGEMYEEYIYIASHPAKNDAIEYFSYVNLIYTIFLLIFERFVFEVDANTCECFDLYTFIDMSSGYNFDKISFNYNMEAVPSLDDVEEIILREWG